MKVGANELKGILLAYKQVMEASWPSLHPAMAERSRHWLSASEIELTSELTGYVNAASVPGCRVRIFWKLLPRFVFGGCNALFARDAGLRSPAEIVGLDDYDKRFPWALQAAKYRTDDQAIVNRGAAMLDMVERQGSAAGGTSWVRVGKAPIRTPEGTIIGIFGMYELLDDESGGKLFVERIKHQGPTTRPS